MEMQCKVCGEWFDACEDGDEVCTYCDEDTPQYDDFTMDAISRDIKAQQYIDIQRGK